jgi:hypothetical protein
MNRYLFAPFAAALSVFIFSGVAQAVDQTITCTSTDCSEFSGALFSETNIAPGDSITRTIHVLNTTNPDSCHLKMSATTPFTIGRVGSGDFPFKLFTAIYDGSDNFYGLRDDVGKATNSRTLGNLSNDTPISLGSIAAGGSRDYNWTVYFDETSDNTYQEANTKFNFSIEFKCGSEDKTITDKDEDEGEDGGGGVGGGSGITSAVTGIATQLGFGAFEEVAGTSASATPEIVFPKDDPAGNVKGASTCVDPKFWWVFFIVQFLLCFIFYKRPNKFIQILVDLVFILIFWKFFCPWWDVLVSALIGVFWLLLLRRKLLK